MRKPLEYLTSLWTNERQKPVTISRLRDKIMKIIAHQRASCHARHRTRKTNGYWKSITKNGRDTWQADEMFRILRSWKVHSAKGESMRAVIPLTIVAFAGFGSAAIADTRNDVLERLTYCNTYSDGRTWLDCYYAAAQPERAELGLPAAPQAQTFEPLFHRPAPSGATSLARPAEAGADGGGGFLGLLSADRVPPEQFGLINARPGPGPNVDRIVDRLASYSFTNGKFTVTLANGQIWRQTNGPAANWRSTPASYTATITHGALRTFNLRVQDGARADDTIYKVERIH
ncbi:MAG TPA: hypothetical protein VNW15_02720 [Rhizomicrobium sp.]|nr:hypothetical protein [Rhizomicrobium sp.]